MSLDCSEIGSKARELTLRLEQWSNVSFEFAIKSGGVPVDCTGASVSWEIRRHFNDEEPLKSFTIEWINRSQGTGRGVMYVDLTCGARESDPASRYFHDMIFIDSLANKLPILKGPCIVNRGGPRS